MEGGNVSTDNSPNDTDREPIFDWFDTECLICGGGFDILFTWIEHLQEHHIEHWNLVVLAGSVPVRVKDGKSGYIIQEVPLDRERLVYWRPWATNRDYVEGYKSQIASMRDID